MLERLRVELERPVAAHAARAPYALGLAAALLLLAAALPGLGLALLFDPARLPALLGAGLAALLRGLHAWASSLLVAVVLVHLLRVGATAAYRRSHRRTWLLGLAALSALLAMFWLGVTLRGDQQGFEAWRHGVEVLQLAGLRAPAAAPLSLLFWLHVLAVPAVLALAVALHVLRVRRLGLAPLSAGEPRVRFSVHARAGARNAAIVLVAVAVLAVAAPPPLGPAPLPLLEAARAPWPFAWLVPLQDAVGTPGIVVGLGAAALVLAALPALDARSPAAARAALAALALLVLVLGLLGLLAPRVVHLLA